MGASLYSDRSDWDDDVDAGKVLILEKVSDTRRDVELASEVQWCPMKERRGGHFSSHVRQSIRDRGARGGVEKGTRVDDLEQAWVGHSQLGAVFGR